MSGSDSQVIRSLDMNVPSPTPADGATGGKSSKASIPSPRKSAGKKSSSSVTSSKCATPTEGQKRDIQGKGKRSTKDPDPAPTEDNYCQVIHELAAAVAKPPVKRDTLEMWTDVLVADMRQLSEDVQYEAQHAIDGYIMRLRRSSRSQAFITPANSSGVYGNANMMANSSAGVFGGDNSVYAATQTQYNQGNIAQGQGAGSCGNQQISAQVNQQSQTGVFNPPATPQIQGAGNLTNSHVTQNMSHQQQSSNFNPPPMVSNTNQSANLAQQQSQVTQNQGQGQSSHYITLANYSPGSSQGLPGILNHSPTAAEYLQKLLGQTQNIQNYNGPI